LRLLLAEDEIGIVELLTEALTKTDFVVAAVQTCVSGLSTLSTPSYGAVVLDLGLPDGYRGRKPSSRSVSSSPRLQAIVPRLEAEPP
jgi:DNA-binding response OmpR family regulator